MGLTRITFAAIGGFVFYKLAIEPRKRSPKPALCGNFDGLSATFRTHEEATLAVEHLVQEYGIEPSFIYVDPVSDENTAGVAPNGGDHAAGQPGHADRSDAPCRGEIELTVPAKPETLSRLRRALEDVGAVRVEAF